MIYIFGPEVTPGIRIVCAFKGTSKLPRGFQLESSTAYTEDLEVTPRLSDTGNLEYRIQEDHEVTP